MKQYVIRILEENFASQVDLSMHMGIDRSHLGKLINGRHKPHNSTIKFIAQGLSQIDSQEWIVHARNIREAINPPVLRIIEEEE